MQGGWRMKEFSSKFIVCWRVGAKESGKNGKDVKNEQENHSRQCNPVPDQPPPRDRRRTSNELIGFHTSCCLILGSFHARRRSENKLPRTRNAVAAIREAMMTYRSLARSASKVSRPSPGQPMMI